MPGSERRCLQHEKLTNRLLDDTGSAHPMGKFGDVKVELDGQADLAG